MSARILLVEDDPVSREVIAAMLTSRGYEVDTADDGFGALRMAQDTNYGLVFIDYHLPEMDGYALARLMRSLGEKTNANLKMVAITADQFGLAARRGVDKIFDRLLTKPIAPDDLFAFVDQTLGPEYRADALMSFLEPNPEPIEKSAPPALALWRARGFDRLPTAKAYPSPTAAEQASIATCFEITESASADCVLLLRSAGIAAVETLRREASSYLMPLIVLDSDLSAMADALFEPSNGESWSKVADLLRSFNARRNLVAPDIASSGKPEFRLAAYMFAADRRLELHRSPSGQTITPYAGGFATAMVVEAVKKLASAALIDSRLEPTSTGEQRLRIALNTNGANRVRAAPIDCSQAQL